MRLRQSVRHLYRLPLLFAEIMSPRLPAHDPSGSQWLLRHRKHCHAGHEEGTCRLGFIRHPHTPFHQESEEPPFLLLIGRRDAAFSPPTTRPPLFLPVAGIRSIAAGCWIRSCFPSGLCAGLIIHIHHPYSSNLSKSAAAAAATWRYFERIHDLCLYTLIHYRRQRAEEIRPTMDSFPSRLYYK